MKNEIIALPVFQDRLSPLLDESRKFVIITLDQGNCIERTTVEINEQSPYIRIERLKEMGVNVILCGAVSDRLAIFILDRYLQLFSWLSGSIEEIVQQYVNNELPVHCTRYGDSTLPQRCRRYRHGWKSIQRRQRNENSNTST